MGKQKKNVTQSEEKQGEVERVPNIHDPSMMVPAGSEHLYPVWLDAATAGAPTKCDIDTTITVCNTLQSGGYIETACAAAGIPSRRYYDWMNKAERDEQAGKKPGFGGTSEESAYLAFCHAVKIARDSAEQDILKQIHDAKGDKTWMRLAWILERTRPDKFGQRQQITVDHTVKASIEAAPEPPKDLAGFLQRAEEQAQASARLQAIANDAEYTESTGPQQDTADASSGSSSDSGQVIAPAQDAETTHTSVESVETGEE